MPDKKIRIYTIDGDSLSVASVYDEESRLWIEEYIDFETTERYTPLGRPWRSVTYERCVYADPVYRDCGTCGYLIKEQQGDLIGVCSHPDFKKRE
ncbi:MAG: hypothetical protein E7563_02105 [Ruminococcaceae bacterium]|nr:hypothetical protein [Oscillospiraceae bacterium]